MKSAGYSILLIDDDQLLRDMYKTKFTENGMKVSTSSGGEEALQLLQDGLRPDIIIFDLVMPGVDGYALLEALKEGEYGNPVKIVLSNQGQEVEKQRVKELGADGYLVKANSIPSEVLQEVLRIAKPRLSKQS